MNNLPFSSETNSFHPFFKRKYN